MGVVFLQGFDHLSSDFIPKNLGYVLKENYSSGLHTWGQTGGRFNSGRQSINGAGNPTRMWVSIGAVCQVTLGISLDFRGGDAIPVRRFLSTRMGGVDVVFLTTSAKRLQLYEGSGVTSFLASGDVSITKTAGVWNHFELQVFMSGETMDVQGFYSGVLAVSYSGPTKGPVLASYIDRVGYGCANGPSTGPFEDDFYVIDKDGPISGLVGPTARIRAVRMSADGTTLEWDPSCGGDHYIEIDDTETFLGNLISTKVSGEQDTFTVADVSALLSANELFLGGHVTVFSKGSGTPTMGMNAILSGTTTSTQAIQSTSWNVFNLPLASAPGYASWNTSNLDNLEIGVEYV